MNWKLFAIIAATAVATAAAVVFLLQKQNEKNRRLFEDYDDDDFNIGFGEQCRRPNDDFAIDIPDDIDEGEPVEEFPKENSISEEPLDDEAEAEAETKTETED